MLNVDAAFTAESRDYTRKVVSGLQMAWKKQYNSTYRAFTIGVSTIGGPDAIATNGGVTSDWNKYLYQDESSYLMHLAYERELTQPTGGMSLGLAEARLSNVSGRFTPRYSGGSSELYTAVYKPRRPMIINSGFNYQGTDHLIPQFIGLTNKTPTIDTRTKTIDLQATDFIDFIKNKKVDTTAMFTGQRTDQIISSSLSTLGFSTAQYDLDYGINIVPFAEVDTGDNWGDFINKLVEAENGIFWQDETGILRFQNRQAWSNSPYNAVQSIISTGQVIEAKTPTTDHIINVVEVKSKPRTKQAAKVILNFNTATILPANTTTEIWLNYDDPILSLTAPTYGGTDSYYLANEQADGSGADVTSVISVKSMSNFAKSSKITFQNNSSSAAYITKIVITGRPAQAVSEIYYREQRDASVTAYEERPFLIDNEYIGSTDWAKSYAGMILNDYANPENLQELTIRAVPQLQLGDLVSWQGRYWRVYGIKTRVDPAGGFTQDLKILQRNITNYFRIGVSTIGGTDQIAP